MTIIKITTTRDETIPCPECNATGETKGDVCNRCQGSGRTPKF
ncbi:TPA: hypothetical protein ACN30P_004882 [Vibrio parahaemolyticus]